MRPARDGAGCLVSRGVTCVPRYANRIGVIFRFRRKIAVTPPGRAPRASGAAARGGGVGRLWRSRRTMEDTPDGPRLVPGPPCTPEGDQLHADATTEPDVDVERRSVRIVAATTRGGLGPGREALGNCQVPQEPRAARKSRSRSVNPVPKDEASTVVRRRARAKPKTTSSSMETPKMTNTIRNDATAAWRRGSSSQRRCSTHERRAPGVPMPRPRLARPRSSAGGSVPTTPQRDPSRSSRRRRRRWTARRSSRGTSIAWPARIQS